MPQLVVARYALGHTRDGLHLVRWMLFGEWRTVHEENTREAALSWLKERFEDIKALTGEECPYRSGA
jgi:hypothetical protein